MEIVVLVTVLSKLWIMSQSYLVFFILVLREMRNLIAVADVFLNNEKKTEIKKEIELHFHYLHNMTDVTAT